MKFHPLPALLISLIMVLLGICAYLYEPESKPKSAPAPAPISIAERAPADVTSQSLETPSDSDPQFLKTRSPALGNATAAGEVGLWRRGAVLQPGTTSETGAFPSATWRRGEDKAAPPPTKLHRDTTQPPIASVANGRTSLSVHSIGSPPADGSRPTTANPAPQRLATLPAAFVEPDPANPPTEEQAAAVDRLQKEFIEKVGGPNQNPNDPQYLARWRKAQPESDQQFKALFGVQAFLERERQGNLAGEAAK